MQIVRSISGVDRGDCLYRMRGQQINGEWQRELSFLEHQLVWSRSIFRDWCSISCTVRIVTQQCVSRCPVRSFHVHLSFQHRPTDPTTLTRWIPKQGESACPATRDWIIYRRPFAACQRLRRMKWYLWSPLGKGVEDRHIDRIRMVEGGGVHVAKTHTVTNMYSLSHRQSSGAEATGSQSESNDEWVPVLRRWGSFIHSSAGIWDMKSEVSLKHAAKVRYHRWTFTWVCIILALCG